jgi:hypothetical protein
MPKKWEWERLFELAAAEDRRMKTADKYVTMDGEELELLHRYETQFGETPMVAFLHPQTSKKMIRNALRRKRPFNERDMK